MFKFYEHLQNILRQNENFLDTDGNILRNKVFQAAMKFDAQLLKILLDNEISRKIFLPMLTA